MAGLIDITRVVVGTEYLTATLVVSEDCPLRTSEDLEGTTRVYNLMPHIINHACMGDAGETFRDCMGDTEICHLLEHMTVELLSRMDAASEVIAGRTWRELAYERTYSVQFPCIDDVLVTGALSSAIWILEWAFTGGDGPVPDIDATTAGLMQLARSLPVKDQVADAIRAAEAQIAFPPEDVSADEPEGDYADDDASDGDSEDVPEEEEDLDRGPRMSRKII
jgi:hypothetical protein